MAGIDLGAAPHCQGPAVTGKDVQGPHGMIKQELVMCNNNNMCAFRTLIFVLDKHVCVTMQFWLNFMLYYVLHVFESNFSLLITMYAVWSAARYPFLEMVIRISG